MKPVLYALLLLTASLPATAQRKQKSDSAARDWSKVDLSGRPSDHLMIQYGYAGWTQQPETITLKGFSRSFNAYFLFDFPFKTNPKLSIGIGAGVGTDNMFFDKTTIDLKNRTAINFRRDTLNLYRKYKLFMGFAEIPLEFRYSTNPENLNKGLKIAAGLKLGLPIDMHTKAKVDKDLGGFGGYIAKEEDRKFLNSTRISATLRFGLGNVSLFGTYTLSELFKEGQGPVVRPYTVGLCLSGL